MIATFPVRGRNNFADTYGATREGGRTHQGVDIFAERGSPVVAVADGVVRFDENKLGGHTAYVRAVDGTVYYYAHLDRYEGEARPVKAGDVIAYVGNTGNAAHTPPHLHFEVHPSGGTPENPFPELYALVAPTASTKPVSPLGGSQKGLLFLVLLWAVSEGKIRL